MAGDGKASGWALEPFRDYLRLLARMQMSRQLQALGLRARTAVSSLPQPALRKEAPFWHLPRNA